LLDHFTASAIVQIYEAINPVYEAINPVNQQKYISLPLSKIVDITWKIASKN